MGAVKTAVDAAASAVTKLEATLLVTTHVIPRPDKSLSLFERKEEIQESSDESVSIVEETPQDAEEVLISNENHEETIIEGSQESEATLSPIISGATLSQWGKTGKIAEMEAALLTCENLRKSKLILLSVKRMCIKPIRNSLFLH